MENLYDKLISALSDAEISMLQQKCEDQLKAHQEKNTELFSLRAKELVLFVKSLLQKYAKQIFGEKIEFNKEDFTKLMRSLLSNCEKRTVEFKYVEEAHKWMSSQTNIDVKKVYITTEQQMGMFANHTNVASVKVSYSRNLKPSGFIYGICEQEITKMFKKANVEKLIDDWKEANPNFTCVDVQTLRNSRGSSSSVAFGFGLDYIEHVKLVITYKYPAENCK